MGFTVAGAVMRITPAHAGKTYALDIVYKGVTDHPRACGENSLAPIISISIVGSPPRMRGKLLAALSELLFTRITPAHAGKT